MNRLRLITLMFMRVFHRIIIVHLSTIIHFEIQLHVSNPIHARIEFDSLTLTRYLK